MLVTLAAILKCQSRRTNCALQIGWCCSDVNWVCLGDRDLVRLGTPGVRHQLAPAEKDLG